MGGVLLVVFFYIKCFLSARLCTSGASKVPS